MMPAIGLVVVEDGFARTCAPQHVDLRVINLDQIKLREEEPVLLPRDIGFEHLVDSFGGLEEGVHYRWMEPGYELTEEERDGNPWDVCACGHRRAQHCFGTPSGCAAETEDGYCDCNDFEPV